MKRIIFFILLLLAAPCFADVDTFEGQTVTDTWEGSSTVDTREGQTIAAGGATPTPTPTPTYTCVGWPSTGCVPDGTPTSDFSTADGTIMDASWTATESGTASSIIAYIPAWGTTTGYALLYVYDSDNDEWDVLCRSDSFSSPSVSSWNEFTMTTGTCSFSTNDVLRVSLAWSGSGLSSVGREDSGGAGSWYSLTDPITFTDPFADGDLSPSSNRQMGMILKYE